MAEEPRLVLTTQVFLPLGLILSAPRITQVFANLGRIVANPDITQFWDYFRLDGHTSRMGQNGFGFIPFGFTPFFEHMGNPPAKTSFIAQSHL